MDSDDYLLSPSQEEEIWRNLSAENVCNSQLNLGHESMIDLNEFVNETESFSPDLANTDCVKMESCNPQLVTDSLPMPSSATSKMPSSENYPGLVNFSLELPGLDGSTGKAWTYSTKLNKVFINVFKILPIRFQWKQNKVQNMPLYVRAMLVYTSAQFFQDPVERCRHHAYPIEGSDTDVGISEHVIRSKHRNAMYHVDADSQRRSVVIPLDRPQAGDDTVTAMYTFHCKNSCSSGMNRRATQIIFTLETDMGVVMARRLLKVRICSCPKRDKIKEEMETGTSDVRPLKRPMMHGVDKPNKKLCANDNAIQTIQVPIMGTKTLPALLTFLLVQLSVTAREERRELTDQEKHLQACYHNMLDDISS